jgi:hypothetical protein
MKTIMISSVLLLAAHVVLCSFAFGMGATEATETIKLKNLEELPQVFSKVSGMNAMIAKKQDATNLVEKYKLKEKDPAIQAFYVVGKEDLIYYYYIEIDLPACLKDADGGTIRLIMQHETNPNDQMRIIDEHIATEYDNNEFGARGRGEGLYGSTRQSSGGEYYWILDAKAAYTIAKPWEWSWIVNYKMLDDGSVFTGDKIRIYSHPHVTTRVIIKDF